MTLKLKTTRLRDVPALLSMVQEYHEYDSLPFDAVQIELILKELIQTPALGRLWNICHGDETVGYALVSFGFSIEYLGRNAFIDEMFIKKEARGRGYGFQVLELIREEAKGLGIRAIHLEAEKSNERAIHLYRKFGFKDPDRVLMTYWIK